VVLIDSGVSAVNPVTRQVQASVRDLADPVPTEFARGFQASTAYVPLPEDFLEGIVAESLKLPARLWREVFLPELGASRAGRRGSRLLHARDVIAPRSDEGTRRNRAARHFLRAGYSRRTQSMMAPGSSASTSSRDPSSRPRPSTGAERAPMTPVGGAGCGSATGARGGSRGGVTGGRGGELARTSAELGLGLSLAAIGDPSRAAGGIGPNGLFVTGTASPV
jgi:hypothetical protein